MQFWTASQIARFLVLSETHAKKKHEAACKNNVGY